MLHAIQRNVALILGMVLCGFICIQALPYLTARSGAAGPTALMAISPVRAIAALLLCTLLGSCVAAAVGRYTNAAVGLFVLGVGFYVLDGRLQTIAAPAFGVTPIGVGAGDPSVNGGAVLLTLAFESLLLAGLALVAVMLVFRLAGPLHDIEPDESDRRPHWLLSTEALKAAMCGVLVLPVVWLIGQSPMKGQMIAAAFLGSLLAGLAGRLVSPHVQPKLLFVSPIIFGALGQVLGWLSFKAPLDVAFVTQTLSRLNQPMPLDYLAGSLAGVAMGLGWARSFLHHEETSPSPRAA